MEQLVGQSLDRYRLVALLGEGGMGAVFRAYDLTLQRDVAVKVMHPQFARQADFQERFLREARSAAQMNHLGIVQIHDFGQAQSHLYIVMEFIPGGNLRMLLRDLKATNQWIALDAAIQLVRQVALAIDYAHRHGVLHRDIKPDNIMLRFEPGDELSYQPVITDLGLAKLLEGEELTLPGASMGTPAYMSPEQALGEQLDARSDVYSLGILLYELAVGQLPFPIENLAQAIRYHTKELPPAPRSVRPDLPASVEAVVLKALSKEPDRRFADARALAVALAGTLPNVAQVVSKPTAMTGAVSLLTPFQQSIAERRGASIFEEFPDPADLGQDRVVIMAGDRTSRSVSLGAKGLTIGRDSDNDLVIQDPSASRHHARVDFDGTNYRVLDLRSTNGTYLAGVKLLPGVPGPWTPDKPLRIGDTWLRLERTGQQSGLPGPTGLRGDGARMDPSQSRASQGANRVGLFVDETGHSVEPGSSTTVRFVVQNLGPVVDHFLVTAAGVPADWVQVPASALRLMPNKDEEVQVTIRPPRSPLSRAGQHQMTVRIASRDVPDEMAEFTLPLTVTAFYELGLDLRPRKQSSMGQASFEVQVSNRSNAGLRLRLEATDPEDACRYTFEAAPILMPAGQERTIQLRVQPQAAMPSNVGKSYHFTVTARPDEAPEVSKQVQGEWAQTPPVFEMSVRPQRQSGLTDGNFRLYVANHGNTDLNLQLEAGDPEEGCLYTLKPSVLSVPAGTERECHIYVQPRKPLSSLAARTYAFTVTARPREAPALTRQAQGEWVHTAPTFDLKLGPKRQEGQTEGNFGVQIYNRGNTDLTLQLAGADPAGSCTYSFELASVEVPAGQDRLVKLKVRAKSAPPVGGSRPYFFTVTARLAEAPRLTWEAQGEWVQVPPTLELVLDPPTQIGKGEADFSVQVRNISSEPVNLQLVAADPAGACRFTLDPAKIRVPAGGLAPVQLKVRPKAAHRGEEARKHTFTVTAHTSDAPGLTRQVQGLWEEVSRRPQRAARVQPAAVVQRPPATPARPKRRSISGCTVLLIVLALIAVGLYLAGGLPSVVNESQLAPLIQTAEPAIAPLAQTAAAEVASGLGGPTAGMGTFRTTFNETTEMTNVSYGYTLAGQNVCAFHNLHLAQSDVGKQLTYKIHDLSMVTADNQPAKDELNLYLYRSLVGAVSAGDDMDVFDHPNVEEVLGPLDAFSGFSWRVTQPGDYVICLLTGVNWHTYSELWVHYTVLLSGS